MYMTLLAALSQLEATVKLRWLPFGADAAPRVVGSNQLMISFHSHGSGGNILRIKESYIPPYYTIDPLGYSGFAELALAPEKFFQEINEFDLTEANAILSELHEQIRQSNLSKYPQPQNRRGWLPEDYVFVPLQTVDDPIARFRSFDQLEAVWEAADFGASRGMAVVVKRHPLCRADHVAVELEKLKKEFPNLLISDTSVHRLIEGARYVLGCNSGVLFEALIHGKNVISFGASDFSLATICLDQRGQISDALSRERAIDPEFRDRFLGWYLSRYCVHAADTAAIRQRIERALADMGIDASLATSQAQSILFDYAAAEGARRKDLLSNDPKR